MWVFDLPAGPLVSETNANHPGQAGLTRGTSRGAHDLILHCAKRRFLFRSWKRRARFTDEHNQWTEVGAETELAVRTVSFALRGNK